LEKDFNLETAIENTTKIVVSIGEASNYIKDIVSISGFNQSIYLEGPSGIGKSEIIAQLSEYFNSNLIDLRLGNLDIIDLNGIGVPDLEKKIAYWTRPEFYPPEDSDQKYILFLDEFNHASEAVFGAAYQLVLERRMGTHILPENVLIVAAGNGIDDNGISFSLPSPLTNRFMKINVTSNTEEWLEYAETKNIDWKILSFLKTYPEYLHRFRPETNEDNFPTPRNWIKSNDFIKSEKFKNEKQFREVILNSLFGFSTMVHFEAHLKLIENVPLMEDVLKGRKVPNLSTELNSSYAFFLLSRTYLTNNILDITDNQLFNLIAYADKQPNQEVMQRLVLFIFSIVNKSLDKSRFNTFHHYLLSNEDKLKNNKEFKRKMIEFTASMK